MEPDAFLDRIAARLKRPRPVTAPPRPVRGVPDFQRGGVRDPATRFREELERLGGRAFVEPDAASAAARLRAVVDELRPRAVTAWAPEEFAGLEIGWLFAGALGSPLEADLGVTAADFAVAETGTLVLTTGPGRPRLASLAPAAHVALVPRSRLVPRLGDALAELLGDRSRAVPGAVQCITGPSRTADIENDLSIGVHGPATVTVILWG